MIEKHMDSYILDQNIKPNNKYIHIILNGTEW